MTLTVWLIALAVGGVMVGAGIAIHPALIVGGAFITLAALVKSLEAVWSDRA